MLNKEKQIPKHVGIIMDGNGRWAELRGVSRSEGHYAGMYNLKTISRVASNLGVKVLTVYAFSTENWKRPVKEVRYLMSLPGEFFEEFMPDIMAERIKVTLSGVSSKVPDNTLKVIREVAEKTKDHEGMVLNFAFNYGGRLEIINATKAIAEAVKNGEIKAKDINEDVIESHLQSSAFIHPYEDIDLVIRTSGEQRLSNFMLWQVAYSEFYFTDKHWPEFDEEEFNNAIDTYNHRDRRFGGVGPKLEG